MFVSVVSVLPLFWQNATPRMRRKPQRTSPSKRQSSNSAPITTAPACHGDAGILKPSALITIHWFSTAGFPFAIKCCRFLYAQPLFCLRQVMMGDGQVSQGDMVVKPNATKVRKLADGRVLAGYAGSTADALTLMERLEGKLEEHDGASRHDRWRRLQPR